MFHCPLGVRLQRGAGNLSQERDGAIRRDLVGEVIEHAIKRQQHELVMHFLDNAVNSFLSQTLTVLCARGVCLLTRCGGSRAAGSSGILLRLTMRVMCVGASYSD